jgi:hypothetical protein
MSLIPKTYTVKQRILMGIAAPVLMFSTVFGGVGMASSDTVWVHRIGILLCILILPSLGFGSWLWGTATMNPEHLNSDGTIKAEYIDFYCQGEEY